MRRRAWLLSATGVAGALVVGWGLLPARFRIGSPDLLRADADAVALNGWIKIGLDGSVVLAMPRSEMGQGVHTSLPMLVAEELDVALSQVRIEQAGVNTIYGNVATFVASLPFHPSETDGEHRPVKVRVGQWMVGKLARELGINVTGGSSSVADDWDVLRLAAATARASLQCRLPAAELTVRMRVVSHPFGKLVRYADLAKLAAVTPPGKVKLKSSDDWQLIGRPVRRLDLPAKINGSAPYGLDIRLPGMVFAAVRLRPLLGVSILMRLFRCRESNVWCACRRTRDRQPVLR